MLNLGLRNNEGTKINQKHYFHHNYSSTYHTRNWRERKKLKLRLLKMYHGKCNPVSHDRKPPIMIHFEASMQRTCHVSVLILLGHPHERWGRQN